MFGISFFELAIILTIILVVFKPHDLPLLIKNLGIAMRKAKNIIQESKDITTQIYSSIEEACTEDDSPTIIAAKHNDKGNNKDKKDWQEVEIIGDDGKKHKAFVPLRNLRNVPRGTSEED